MDAVAGEGDEHVPVLERMSPMERLGGLDGCCLEEEKVLSVNVVGLLAEIK